MKLNIAHPKVCDLKKMSNQFEQDFTAQNSCSFTKSNTIRNDRSKFLSGKDDLKLTSIQVQYFIMNKKSKVDLNHSIKGLLSLDYNNLIFKSESKNMQIPLIRHIESAILPHPINFHDENQDLRLLSITYLTNINDNSSFTTLYFSADQQKLRSFLINLIKKSQSIQKKYNYQPPNLGILHIPEFLYNPQKESFDNQDSNEKEQNDLNPILNNNILLKGGKSTLLQESDILNIRKSLPYKFQSYDWNLLFKLSRDGCSYTTLYKKIDGEEPIIFLIKSSSGERIGAFLTCCIKPSTQNYGSRDSFVFTLYPTFASYKLSKYNQNFISSTKDEFSIGGGGHSAIWIDSYFNKAVSENCSSFKSPQLTSKSHFSIEEIEVWTVGELKKNHNNSTSIMKRY